MLLKSEILNAQAKSKSAAQAARYLNVSYPTYKKYAKMHGVFGRVKNKAGKGISKNTQKSRIKKYVNGEKDHQNPKKYLEQLVRYGYKQYQCERCGYDDKRTDGKAPLLLYFKDGDKYNSELENVKVLCYNCYYVVAGVELIGRKTRRYWTTDYFSKYNEDDHSRFKDYEYDDIEWDDVEENVEKAERRKKEKDVDELFEELNS